MITKYKNGVIEIQLKTDRNFNNPFWDVEIVATFSHENDKSVQKVYGFYDGRDKDGYNIWKLRWMPAFKGNWICHILSYPQTEGLSAELALQIADDEVNEKGFLRAYPEDKWGLKFDNGEPFYLFGDTMYNIFGACYCGVDVENVLRRRKEQGINYIRARMQVSPYHPDTLNSWQTRDCWPWGGSSQLPDFTRFKLDYFQAVDKVVSMMADMDMGLEVVFEAWLWEFPFNDRNKFIPEFEMHWFKYIISRYAAYPCVYIWCPANEYEFYPVGEVKYHPEADRWLKRLAAFIKECDPFRHPIGAHNWEQDIPLSNRVGDIKDIDVYLIQTSWGLESEKFNRAASLCMYLESQMRNHSPKRDKVMICAEFGYETADCSYTHEGHQVMDHNHTRRGQWRTGFSGYHVVHGFNNTWGAHLDVSQDPIGTQYLIHFYNFMTKSINFYEMNTAPELLHTASGSEEDGTLPLCLSNEDRSVISVYFPAAGNCTLDISKAQDYTVHWINPRTGAWTSGDLSESGCFTAPQTNEGNEAWGDDWVLLLNRRSEDMADSE